MLHQHTLDKLHALRLTGMATAFEQQLAQPAIEELSFEERFALSLEQQILCRDNRQLARLLKGAKLRVGACVEAIDHRHPRGIDRPFFNTLASCQWVQRQHNLAIPDRPVAARCGWPARWAIRLADRVSRYVTSVYPVCSRRCASPTATAAIPS
jgi:hypothetical protein